MSALAPARSSDCPIRCGYSYPIPACVRLHLIQHHDFTYAEAQAAYPDEALSGGSEPEPGSATDTNAQSEAHDA